jgi:hypothetical protein
MSRGVTKYEDPVSEWLKKEYGDYGRTTASYIELLSEKQREFCARYLVHGKPGQAATEAGFSKSAAAQASHFLNIPKVAAYLNLLAAKREVDQGRASSAEMLIRIKATPVVAANSTPTPEAIIKVTKNLEGGVADLSDGELMANIQGEVNDGIMQVPPVTVPPNVTFGPDWVVEQLIRVAERCLTIEPITDTKGRPIGQFKFQPTQALRALELVGKTLALFTDRIEHTPLEQYEGSELDARIEALVGQHPELQKMMGKIDKLSKPKPKTPGQGHSDFSTVGKGGNRSTH